MKNNIAAIIALIPEDTADEALGAVYTIKTYPSENRAQVRCRLSREFRMIIEVRGSSVVINAEGRKPIVATSDDFIAKLRRSIYEIDEAMAEGTYVQSKPREIIICDRPAPPAGMDIPVWDEKAGEWYDAEY